LKHRSRSGYTAVCRHSKATTQYLSDISKYTNVVNVDTQGKKLEAVSVSKRTNTQFYKSEKQTYIKNCRYCLSSHPPRNCRYMERYVTYVLRKIILLKLALRRQSETFTPTITVTLRRLMYWQKKLHIPPQ